MLTIEPLQISNTRLNVSKSCFRHPYNRDLTIINLSIHTPSAPRYEFRDDDEGAFLELRTPPAPIKFPVEVVRAPRARDADEACGAGRLVSERIPLSGARANYASSALKHQRTAEK